MMIIFALRAATPDPLAMGDRMKNIPVEEGTLQGGQGLCFGQ